MKQYEFSISIMEYTKSKSKEHDLIILDNVHLKPDSEFYKKDINDFPAINIKSLEELETYHTLLNLPYLAPKKLEDFISVDLEFELLPISFDKQNIKKINKTFSSLKETIDYINYKKLFGCLISKELVKFKRK